MENMVSKDINYYEERNKVIESAKLKLIKIKIKVESMKIFGSKILKSKFSSIVSENTKDSDEKVRREIENAFKNYNLNNVKTSDSAIIYDAYNNMNIGENNFDDGGAKGNSYTKRSSHFNTSNASSEQ